MYNYGSYPTIKTAFWTTRYTYTVYKKVVRLAILVLVEVALVQGQVDELPYRCQ